ncbi:MAG TPA: formate dehydrogenase accessory sulfurtransferase FdhD [Flavipsychrobacter sp.]|nr:formate dehydrogenase accessory sulfurtransferase FdhD [Flavipsychrobacter sp.]
MQRDPSPSGMTKAKIHRYKNGVWTHDEDGLAREEPLEIRIRYGPLAQRKSKSISVTMRTPGNDIELALGFLFTESIIQSRLQIMQAAHIAHAKTQESKENIIQVLLREDVQPDLEKLQRNFYTTSSCGVCGKESVDAVKLECPVYIQKDVRFSKNMLLKLPGTLREHQNIFSATGGIHAAAFFNMQGNLLLLREDVGRHNALDKLIGASLFTELDSEIDPTGCILLLSGRASFELLQKAAMAGIPVVCAVGAPSSLALQMAAEFNITLIGFLREDRFNVYTGRERVLE